MRAVVDASPLIYLTKIQFLELLNQYAEVLVPPEVVAEVERGLAKGYTEALQVRRLVEEGKIKVRKVKRLPGEWNLDVGEAAVLALALRERVDEVVVDDRAAIGVSKYLGLRPVSVPFLILRERRSGRLPEQTFYEAINRLMSAGYHLSARLYQQLLDAGKGEK